MDKQYDHQEGFFFNRQITDFELIMLRLSDSWRRRPSGHKTSKLKIGLNVVYFAKCEVE